MSTRYQRSIRISRAFLVACVIAGMIVVASSAACAQAGSAHTDPEYADTRDIAEVLQAAEDGDARSMTVLAWRYGTGTGGVEFDRVVALRWLHRAADAKDARAMFRLGLCYADGIGLEWNFDAALLWYQRAADAGFAEGLAGLAILYEVGLGADQDPERALELYRSAHERGSWIASHRILDRQTFFIDKQVSKSLSKLQQEMLGRLLARAESPQLHLEPEEMLLLAYIYRTGVGVEASVEKSLEWLQKAADIGYPAAFEALGGYYLNLRTPEDMERGLVYLIKAANTGSRDAMFLLYVHHRNMGEADAATRWFARAVSERQLEAIGIIAYLYAQERGEILSNKNMKIYIEMYEYARNVGYDAFVIKHSSELIPLSRP